jgi:hypothetical protein
MCCSRLSVHTACASTQPASQPAPLLPSCPQVALPALSGDIFLPEHEGQLVRLVPQREGHVLELHWNVPACDHLYR